MPLPIAKYYACLFWEQGYEDALEVLYGCTYAHGRTKVLMYKWYWQILALNIERKKYITLVIAQWL